MIYVRLTFLDMHIILKTIHRLKAGGLFSFHVENSSEFMSARNHVHIC